MKVTECQNHGKTRFRVVFRDPKKAGRPYPYSTAFFKTRRSAELFAATQSSEVAGILSDWESIPLEKRIDALRALRRAESGGFTLGAACDAMEAGGASGLSFADLAARTIAAKRSKSIRPRSLRSLQWTLDHFAETHPGSPADVRPEVVAKWIDRPEWSPIRRRGVLINLSAAFALGVRMGWVRRNPCAAIERPVVESKPPGVLSPAQGEKLLRWIEQNDPELVGFAVVCMFAGFRPESEVARLPRSAAASAVASGMLASPGTNKTRRRRVVPVCPALSAFLSVWIPLGVEFRPVNFARRWRAARVAAIGSAWGQDCLRHSWASYRLAQTGDDARTAMEAGHTQTELHRSYKALATPAEAARWFVLRPSVSDYAPARDARSAAARSAEVDTMRELARRRHSGDTLQKRAVEVLAPLIPWTVAQGVEALHAVGIGKESARNSIRALARSGAVSVDKKTRPFLCRVA